MIRILVAIVCYEDPDLLKTVPDLLATAQHPENLRIVIVLQTNAPDLYTPLKALGVEMQIHPASWAEGCGKARAALFSMYEGEDYVFCIDSHMRFEHGWDRMLLEEISSCPSAKPILTTLPPNFVIFTGQRSDPAFTFMAFHQFYRHIPLPRSHSTGLDRYRRTTTPLSTAFLAGGCWFGPGSICTEVPYDPYLYFHGEEHAFNMRLWTHGYDNFAPRFHFVWHAYRAYQVEHVTLQKRLSQEKDKLLNERSLARAQILSGVKARSQTPENFLLQLDRYGLGDIRTVEDWEGRFGINLRNQTGVKSMGS